MSDYAYNNVPVHVRHVPDFSVEDQPDGSRKAVPLPGHYEIGVEVDGAFVVLAVVKGGHVEHLVSTAKAAQQ